MQVVISGFPNYTGLSPLHKALCATLYCILKAANWSLLYISLIFVVREKPHMITICLFLQD